MIFQHSVKGISLLLSVSHCLYVYCVIFVCEVCCAHALIVHTYNAYDWLRSCVFVYMFPTLNAMGHGSIPMTHCLLWCSPGTLVSGSTRFMRIFAGFYGEERMTVAGLSKTVIFSAFGRYVFGTVWDTAKIIMWQYVVPRWLSTHHKMCDLEWPWTFILR